MGPRQRRRPNKRAARAAQNGQCQQEEEAALPKDPWDTSDPWGGAGSRAAAAANPRMDASAASSAKPPYGRSSSSSTKQEEEKDPWAKSDPWTKPPPQAGTGVGSEIGAGKGSGGLSTSTFKPHLGAGQKAAGECDPLMINDPWKRPGAGWATDQFGTSSSSSGICGSELTKIPLGTSCSAPSASSSAPPTAAASRAAPVPKATDPWMSSDPWGGSGKPPKSQPSPSAVAATTVASGGTTAAADPWTDSDPWGGSQKVAAPPSEKLTTSPKGGAAKKQQPKGQTTAEKDTAAEPARSKPKAPQPLEVIQTEDLRAEADPWGGSRISTSQPPVQAEPSSSTSGSSVSAERMAPNKQLTEVPTSTSQKVAEATTSEGMQPATLFPADATPIPTSTSLAKALVPAAGIKTSTSDTVAKDALQPTKAEIPAQGLPSPASIGHPTSKAVAEEPIPNMGIGTPTSKAAAKAIPLPAQTPTPKAVAKAKQHATTRSMSKEIAKVMQPPTQLPIPAFAKTIHLATLSPTSKEVAEPVPAVGIEPPLSNAVAKDVLPPMKVEPPAAKEVAKGSPSSTSRAAAKATVPAKSIETPAPKGVAKATKPAEAVAKVLERSFYEQYDGNLVPARAGRTASSPATRASPWEGSSNSSSSSSSSNGNSNSLTSVEDSDKNDNTNNKNTNGERSATSLKTPAPMKRHMYLQALVEVEQLIQQGGIRTRTVVRLDGHISLANQDILVLDVTPGQAWACMPLLQEACARLERRGISGQPKYHECDRRLELYIELPEFEPLVAGEYDLLCKMLTRLRPKPEPAPADEEEEPFFAWTGNLLRKFCQSLCACFCERVFFLIFILWCLKVVTTTPRGLQLMDEMATYRRVLEAKTPVGDATGSLEKTELPTGWEVAIKGALFLLEILKLVIADGLDQLAAMQDSNTTNRSEGLTEVAWRQVASVLSDAELATAKIALLEESWKRQREAEPSEAEEEEEEAPPRAPCTFRSWLSFYFWSRTDVCT